MRSSDAAGCAVDSLSTRERDILFLMTKGLRNREIGSQIGLSEGGVKYHINRLFAIFGVSNRTELVGQLHDVVEPAPTRSETPKECQSRAAAEGPKTVAGRGTAA
jgi:DNA-binding CsgD family transcriptional regulator